MGSSPGARPEYHAAAEALGTELVARGSGLVYGGAKVGLMGVLADTVLAARGTVSGVIPGDLVEMGVAHDGLQELHVTSSMHERKTLMVDLADAFIALPGGFGTFEEFFEVLTWSQLGLHAKPCGVLNVCGYFDGLLQFLDHSVFERFVSEPHRAMVLEADEPVALLDRMARYEAPVGEKWLDRE
jgi:uncharacterized protein (TIGR00730 family)